VLTVNEDVVVAALGLNVAAAAAGKPDALRLTAPVKPFEGVIVTV
jgi:hypothetical protein